MADLPFSLASPSTTLCWHVIEKVTDIENHQNFKKIGGVYHPKPWATVVIFFKMFAHPVIVLPVLAFSFFAYWW